MPCEMISATPSDCQHLRLVLDPGMYQSVRQSTVPEGSHVITTLSNAVTAGLDASYKPRWRSDGWGEVDGCVAQNSASVQFVHFQPDIRTRPPQQLKMQWFQKHH